MGQWIVSFQKIYGLYGLKHHIVEISGDVTDVGRTDGRTTSEDRATQLLIWETLSLAINIEWKTELEELNNAILSWIKLAKVGKVDKSWKS